MSIENAGYGVGGGVISAILVWVGFKSRLDRLESTYVGRDTCKMCQVNTHNQLTTIVEEQKEIKGMVAKILDNLSRRRGDNKNAD